ncbi:hypothetical protein BGZ57DRAFT_979602 [Hyaloscypha finlandica]|nr:hypothetical protein BGZ57DRAFT_979602 [Hyaloscypha finlandica]
MADIIREAPLCQTLPWVSGKRLFQYQEERSDFELPLAYTAQLNSEKVIQRQRTIDSTPITRSPSSSTSTSDRFIESLDVSRTKSRADTMPHSQGRFEAEQQLALERTKTTPTVPLKTSDGILIFGWYTTDDPANLQNWSREQRAELGVMERFTVNPTETVLPLSLYVPAYGIGPLVFAPLSEITIVGRIPLYWATFLFCALSLPAALVDTLCRSFGPAIPARCLR